MEGEKIKCIKHVNVKGNNKRINVGLFYNFEKKNHFFIVSTKTLVDCEKRSILSTQNIYSVETFAVLADVFSRFLDNSEISNKILNVEISKIEKFTGTSNF